MLPRRSQHLGAWLFFGTALCGHHASAASPHLQLGLEYEADPALSCPSAAELSTNIAAQLGYQPFVADGAEQRLRIHIKKVANRAEAQIEWIDREQSREGERRLASEDGDCSALAQNLSFAVAVQIQLHASAAEPPPPAPVETVRPAVPAPAPTPPPEEPPRAASRRVLLGVGTMARHGLAPGVATGLRLFGAISGPAAALELSAHASLPSERQLDDGTGFTGQELGLNLVPCVRFSPAGLCAVGTLSLLRVRGQGVDHIRAPSALTGGAGGRIQLFWPALERLGVLVQAEALAVLAPQDVLVNQTKVWSTAPLVFTAILDFAAIFP